MSDLLMPTEERNVLISTPLCIHCDGTSYRFISVSEFERLHAGEAVRSVFPDIYRDEVELLITGIHSDCWDDMFGDDDE